MRYAARHEGTDKSRIQSDRFTEIGDRAIVLFRCVINLPSPVIGNGPLRIEPDCLVIVGDGAIVVFPDKELATAIGEREYVSRVEPNRLVELGKRSLLILLSLIFVAAKVMARSAC